MTVFGSATGDGVAVRAGVGDAETVGVAGLGVGVSGGGGEEVSVRVAGLAGVWRWDVHADRPARTARRIKTEIELRFMARVLS
jgi:hypothetical protein